MDSKTKLTSVRMPADLVEKVERVRASMQRAAGVPVTKTSTITRLLEVGAERELERLSDEDRR